MLPPLPPIVSQPEELVEAVASSPPPWITIGAWLAGAAVSSPERPIRTPIPRASSRVPTPAISAALGEIPFFVFLGAAEAASGGWFIASMKTTASMNGSRGSPRRWPHSRQ